MSDCREGRGLFPRSTHLCTARAPQTISRPLAHPPRHSHGPPPAPPSRLASRLGACSDPPPAGVSPCLFFTQPCPDSAQISSLCFAHSVFLCRLRRGALGYVSSIAKNHFGLWLGNAPPSAVARCPCPCSHPPLIPPARALCSPLLSIRCLLSPPVTLSVCCLLSLPLPPHA